jgi:hypothetical protein
MYLNYLICMYKLIKLIIPNMLLVIRATLSAPPSSVHCFRDLSLYATTFCKLEVVTCCDIDTKDFYWHWLKRHGAMDFIKDILYFNEITGYVIGDSNLANFKIPRLDAHSINRTIGKVNELQTL